MWEKWPLGTAVIWMQELKLLLLLNDQNEISPKDKANTGSKTEIKKGWKNELGTLVLPKPEPSFFETSLDVIHLLLFN